MNQPSGPLPSVPHFLTAPGVLGAQILAHDWSQTPLGPIAGWPQSLKAVVSLMLSSPQPMWMSWGDQATFLYNDAYINVLTEAKHPWALGRPVAEVWAEIWDYCGPLVARVFQHGDATLADDVRLFLRRADFLEEMFYSFSYSPVRDESGRVAGLFCPSLDVTAKHLNARRLRTLSDLSSRSLQEKTVFDACASAIAALAGNPDDLPFAQLYLADPDGGPAQLVRATHAGIAAEYFPVGAVIADGVGREVALGQVAGLPQGLANQALRQALVLPLAGAGHQAAVGALVLGVSAARKLDDDYRSFLQLIATQAGNAIQQARASEGERLRVIALAELDQAKTQFFSNVSHEFRTPLTLLLGPLEDALDDVVQPLPPAQRERLQLMHRNGLRLQKLVNTLLDFSRVQAGRAHANFVPTDLAALTSDLASSFRSAVEGAGMRLTVDCPPLASPVYVDRTMWEKIVLNLLSNAFKFTFEGEIRVSLRGAGQHVRLCVADSGTGIAPDQVPRLFERFHRVEGARARTHEGSGIGLALVNDLVTLHGGDIDVRSELDSGTEFCVAIPLGTAHLDPAQIGEPEPAPQQQATRAYLAEVEGWLQPASAPRAAAAASAAAARRGRLLIVDDNADMRDYLQRLLEGEWQVELRTNGVEALEAMARQAPDMILSDVMMPQLDGFGLLAAVRANPAVRGTPFIMLSARAGEEARLEGLQAGADDYLVKPFSGRELVTRIDLLRQRQQARTVEQAVARRTQSIFSQAPVAIAILRGPQHVFEQANAYYQELVGQRPLAGLPIRAAMPELEGQGIYELLDGVLQTARPYVGRSMLVRLLRGQPAQLSDCYFDFVYQPLLDDAGQPEGVAVVVFEVTELANAKRAAEKASRAKDEFLAMLGHELRNPLAPIVTALQLMQLRGGDYAVKERAVIERQTNHLVALVDDLLDVSRVAEGKIHLRRQPVQMAEVVARAIETASPLIEQKRHVLELDVPASGLAVMADPTRCAQVVANLLTNAAKYTEQEGRLSVRAWRDGDEVAVQVRDNGIGISSEILGSVFDLFVQERQALSRSQGGLGLGLTIAKSMVALHGGRLQAHSDGIGCGSTFTMHIPVLEQAADEPAAAAPSADSGGAALADGLRVMVVDDNEDAARALGEALELMGHAVQVVFSAPAALELAPLLRPDICLLDIGLPGMDGYELAVRLRQQLAHGSGKPRLFAVTGYGQDADRQRAMEAGFEQHLTKPIELGRLEAMLRAVVGE
ncbi:hybrid signal transduction histidine kinase D [Janthinobacterium sp. HH01]|uniref:ATP-binding protein n=1 Tax=Janthinobacterium sp. HH01 TaxID=1198452 RepID=UPI0002AE8D7F|nr:ATP-binding protein [Janthinobacterium sp. HH01]ELX07992.1 hybrid signal transduction histidine kinase D [Janthinobacterium sp. HH01]